MCIGSRLRHCTTPGQQRDAYSKTVGLSGLERQSCILIKPYVVSGWGHVWDGGRDGWDVSIPVCKVHQRCIGDWLGTTGISNGHEVFEQWIMLCVVPMNDHRQTRWSLTGTKPDEPIAKYHSVFVIVRLNLFQGVDDKGSTETVSILALSEL